MTLTEIKEKLIAKLKTLTLDDLFIDPKLSILHDILKYEYEINTNEELLEFLINKVRPNSLDLVYGELESLEENLSALKWANGNNYELKRIVSDVERIDIQIKEIERQIGYQESLEKKLINENETINNDIEKLNLVPTISIYSQQMKFHENKKNENNTQIKNINNKIVALNTNLDSLKLNRVQNLKIAEELRGEEMELENRISNIKEELRIMKSRDSDLMKMELKLIEFISILLLSEKYYLFERGLTKTRDIEGYRCKSIIDKIISKNDTPPDNWKEIIFSAFKTLNKCYDGILSKHPISQELNGYEKVRERNINKEKLAECYLSQYKEVEPMNIMESSFILAIKQSIKYNNPRIRTSDDGILLQLSGGLSAEIYFRKKGDLIKDKWQEKVEIYRNMLLSNKHINKQSLYSQGGYDLTIDAPCGFYLVTKDYAIEIYFRATPILFDSLTVAKMASHVAPIEAQKQKEREVTEEERRRNDDYYYDDWDD